MYNYLVDNNHRNLLFIDRFYKKKEVRKVGFLLRQHNLLNSDFKREC
jgi:hypothetical protein